MGLTLPRLDAAVRAAYLALRQALRRDGRVLVPFRDQQARLAACYTCPHRDGRRCGLCTCFLAPKSALTTETCPDGRWSN